MEEDLFTYLPSDITIDILSRLPVAEIVRCKCVCKSWLHLVESPDFVEPHLSKSVPGLAWYEHTYPRQKIIHLSDIYEFANHYRKIIHPSPPPSDIYEFAECKNSDHYQKIFDFRFPAEIHSSVNGLVFLYGSCFVDLYVCNPITGDILRLPPPSSSHGNTFGFGVSKVSRQYKIVKISNKNKAESECEVYTLGNGAGAGEWRSIDPCSRFYGHNRSTASPFLNGMHHWLVTDVDGCMQISCFDYETQVFTTFSPTQVFTTFSPGDCQTFSVFEDCLCLCNSSVGEIVIWLMKEHGNDESWTKEFIIKTDARCNPIYNLFVPLKLFEDGDILIAVETFGRIYCYSTKTKTIKLVEPRKHVNTKIVPYTPSFLLVPKPWYVSWF